MATKAVDSMIRVEDGIEEVLCPNCRMWLPRDSFSEFTVAPRFAALLTPVLQCQRETGENRTCRHIFAVTEMALLLRQALLAGVEGK